MMECREGLSSQSLWTRMGKYRGKHGTQPGISLAIERVQRSF